MTETEILQHAKSYIDKLANGINPLTGEKASESDIINNVRISRCLFYVSDVLRQVIEEKTYLPAKKTKKIPFSISASKKNEYVYSDTPVTLSGITYQLNRLADSEECRKISRRNISDWLVEKGDLKIKEYNGKTRKYPTAAGYERGISTKRVERSSGEYTAVIYNTDAQHYIIDNLDAISAFAKRERRPEKDGQSLLKQNE